MDNSVPLEVQFTAMELRLIKFLGQGVTQVNAAAAVGVSPAFVCQCMARPEFAAQVSERLAERTAQYADQDQLADNIQYEALKRLQSAVRLTNKTNDLLNIISKMDQMKRRNSTPIEEKADKVITLVLPVVAIPQLAVTVDTKNRVIDIDGATMLPASRGQVEKMAGGERNGRKVLSGPQTTGASVSISAGSGEAEADSTGETA